VVAIRKIASSVRRPRGCRSAVTKKKAAWLLRAPHAKFHRRAMVCVNRAGTACPYSNFEASFVWLELYFPAALQFPGTLVMTPITRRAWRTRPFGSSQDTSILDGKSARSRAECAPLRALVKKMLPGTVKLFNGQRFGFISERRPAGCFVHTARRARRSWRTG